MSNQRARPARPYVVQRQLPQITLFGSGQQARITGRQWQQGENAYEDIYAEPVPASVIKTWTIPVTNISGPRGTLLFPANPDRLSILISNISAAIVYLGAQPSVQIGGGDTFPVGAGQSLAMDSYIGLIYAVAAAPNSLVGLLELSLE